MKILKEKFYKNVKDLGIDYFIGKQITVFSFNNIIRIGIITEIIFFKEEESKFLRMTTINTNGNPVIAFCFENYHRCGVLYEIT